MYHKNGLKNILRTFGRKFDIHKGKFIKIKPTDLETMNTENNNFRIVFNREENNLNKHYFLLESEFIVSDSACGGSGKDANIKLVNYGILPKFC